MKPPNVWAHYTPELDLMFVVMNEVAPVTNAVLVYGDDKKTDLVIAIEAYLKKYNIGSIELQEGGGCRVFEFTPFGRNKVPKKVCYTKKYDSVGENLYKEGYSVVTKAGGGFLDNYGTLSTGARDSAEPGED
jgi:hypothetical protein